MLAQELESRHENYLTEDAEMLLVGFGIVARVLRSAIDQLAGARREGWPVPAHHAVAVPLARAARDGEAREVGAGS